MGNRSWAKERRWGPIQAVREAPWFGLLIWPTVGQRQVLSQEKDSGPRRNRALKKSGSSLDLG